MFALSNIVKSTYVHPSGVYWTPGFPNPSTPSSVFLSSCSNITVDACPSGWTKIPRKMSVYNVGVNGAAGNVWKSNDYSTMLSRYPVDTFFYLVYKGKFFRLRFNSAENAQIKNTNFWYSTDFGTTWLDIPSSTGYLDEGWMYGSSPYISVTEVFP